MQKAKKYDWKDSNMALFGSDTEKQVKKESAMTEEAWQGCGQEECIKVWRVVKFQIEDWPEAQYGEFFEGDSYIILKTYKEDGNDELLYDVYFWIGKYSTQDEYGTAAYKTVELDTFLDDKPVQHREVQNHETEGFKNCFESLSYMKGGADTGFNKVEPTEYKRRLFLIKKEPGQKASSQEIAVKRCKLNSGDVFILDTGTELIQWNGSECSHHEKFKAAQVAAQMKSSRGDCEHKVLEEGDLSDDSDFYKYFEDEDDDDDDDDDDDVQDEETGEIRGMAIVSDRDGSIGLEETDERVLVPDAVCLVECDRNMFVWVGEGASIDEKKNGFYYATEYLKGKGRNYLAISVFTQGKKPEGFPDIPLMA